MSHAGSTPDATEWWAPGRADWQVAALFSIGATCFALGALPGYASLVGLTADDATYAIGSVFFTLAALLQFLISIGVVRADERPRSGAHWRTGAHPRSARVVVGHGAVRRHDPVQRQHLLRAEHPAQLRAGGPTVWAPDVFGSIVFLVASALAYAGVRRPWLRWRPRDLDWSVTTLNMVGSIAFGISAFAAKAVGPTGDLRNVALMNLGTFVGALCFLAGAVLLIPDEAAHQ